jgi:CMP/dCMP kinase
VSEVITIDGPVSSGKNSVALLFSKKIGYQFVDSGSIYRAFCVAILKEGISIDDDHGIDRVLNSIELEYEFTGEDQRVILDGVDITSELHSTEVTSIVPHVSAKKFVRAIATKLQRKITANQDTVMTGRDIGTEIFPDAKLKFYLTATSEVRAQRRLIQLKEKDPNVTYGEVLRQVLERDEADTTRDISPLRKPSDAIVIDTTSLTTEQSVDEFMRHFNKRR